MKEQLQTAIAAVVHDLYDLEVVLELTHPDEKFGDFATNIALQITKQVGKNPRQVAEELAAELRTKLTDTVADVSIAGPGFLNLTLTDQALLSLMVDPTLASTGHEVVIETNNPNPFKAMHIGHAFNAILGDTLANLLETGGNTVYRVSYHGDVGAHVGKSMWALLRYVDGDPAKLDAIQPAERNSFMSRMYAEGAKAYKESSDVELEVHRLAEESFTLEDPLFKVVYETCKAWSFELLDATIARLGNLPAEKRYLESAADAIGVATVKDHVGTVFQESNGALIFEGKEYGSFTNVFVASNGRGLYAARDLGLMQLKQQDYPAAVKSYIVTAEEQRSYFIGVIKAAELCLPSLNDLTVNISTGTVKLATGKMSSRTGDVLDIAWLFEQIEQAVRDRGAEPTPETMIGALRYEFLRVRIGGDVIFDVKEAVSVTGNSGPYLQYAHARARSILTKVTAATDTNIADLEPGERSLVLKITEYGDVVTRATRELAPHLICTYLYELAQTFNRFYEHNRVVDDEREAVRAALVARYADTLKAGLSIIGIASPDKM